MKFFLLVISFFTTQFYLISSTNIFIDEDFANLSKWQHIKLPLASGPSNYEIIKDQNNSILKTSSNNSASSLQYLEEFNVYEYPLAEWKWKVDNIFPKGNIKKKNGDDYPIRIYINFKYIKEKADSSLRFRYNFVKKVYKLELPLYSLNYIWANREHDEKILPNPFDPERSKVIILKSGSDNLSTWKTESINIIEDYKKSYGELPPKQAYIAIMNDSDNTHQSAVSYIDYIKIYK